MGVRVGDGTADLVLGAMPEDELAERLEALAAAVTERLADSSSMGLRDIGKRLKASVEELDNARLQGRFVGKELTPIEELPLRTPIRVGGEVTRMRITPRSGTPALEVVVCDGTGDLVVVFTGRRTVGGMGNGRGVLFEGVAHQERGRPVLLNPAYTLLPDVGPLGAGLRPR